VVAQDEWIGPAMITIDLQGHGVVAFDVDEPLAQYPRHDCLTASLPAPRAVGSLDVRALIEVQRRHGGLAPRALLGGCFIAASGESLVVEVPFTADHDSAASPCPSRLWKRPFRAGLPAEFAQAVLESLTGAVSLPAGILRIDRAGFDEVESSAVVFRMAAHALYVAIAATLSSRDVESELRELVEAW
jgi:hypothetical protein